MEKEKDRIAEENRRYQRLIAQDDKGRNIVSILTLITCLVRFYFKNCSGPAERFHLHVTCTPYFERMQRIDGN